MGLFSNDPTMMLRNVSKTKASSNNQLGGQYQPNQYVDYTDQMTENGTIRAIPRIVDMNQHQQPIGVSDIPDALSWNTYGSPTNPENQFFREKYERAQKIKWEVNSAFKRTPAEAEDQKNLFWLASKYNLRMNPFKKDTEDDSDVFTDNLRGNFGDDKEGHYEAFRGIVERNPEMAKKIHE